MIPNRVFITVHDSATIRDSPDHGYDFTKNGLAILQPEECTVVEERNGGYYCELTHPIDDAGAWKHLNENNVLSVPIIYHGEERRQLFRIAVREVRDTQNHGKRIYVLAHHIFYDLRARVVIKPEMYYGGVKYAIDKIFSDVYTQDGFIGKEWYPYTYSSDIEDNKVYKWTSPLTIPALLLGDDHSLVNLYGGEIYRDNFYFSINKKKEGSTEEVEPLRYGVNMLDITEHVDWSQYCNYAHAYDNFDYWKDVSFTTFGSAFGDIVKAQQFNYKYFSEENLTEDMFELFGQYSQPAITYTVTFADIRAKPEYAAFTNLQTYEVGDTVRIINERIGINTTQIIVRKVYDVLRRKTISIELGNIPRSITRRSTLQDTAFESTEDVKAIRAQMAGKKSDPEYENSGEIFNDYDNNTASAPYSNASGVEATATGFGASAESKSTANGTWSHADSGSQADGVYANSSSGGFVGADTKYCRAGSGGTVFSNGSEYSDACAGASVQSGNKAFAAAGAVADGDGAVSLGEGCSAGKNALAGGKGCKAIEGTVCLGVNGITGYTSDNEKIVFAIGDGEDATDEGRHNKLYLTETGKLYINDTLVFGG